MGRVSGRWPAGDGAPRPPRRRNNHPQDQRQDLSHPAGQKRGQSDLREEAVSFFPLSAPHRRPERNPAPGSLSTAELVPFFAAADISSIWYSKTGGCPEFPALQNHRPTTKDWPRSFASPVEISGCLTACSAKSNGWSKSTSWTR